MQSNFFFDFDLKRPKFLLSVTVALAGALLMGALMNGSSNFLDIESEAFLLNYTEDRPVIDKVFDVRKNDWDCYQAREFSYFIDYLDASFIAFSARLGWLHFYSLSHFLLILSIVAMHMVWGRRYFPKVGALSLMLLALLYVTSPTSYITNFFRSAKVLTASLTFLLLYQGFCHAKRLVHQTSIQWGQFSIVFGLSLLLSLADRQGFFFVLSFFIIAGIFYFCERQKHWLLLGGAFGLAAVSNVFYNLLLGPWLIYQTNGYQPDFTFQDLKFLEGYKELPLKTLFGRLLRSLLVVFESVDFMMGGMILGGAAITGGALYTLKKSTKTKHYLRNPWILVTVASVGLLFVMNFLMVSRADYVLWDEHKLYYYFIPTTAILLFGVTLFLNQLSESFKRLPKLLPFILVLMLLGNLLSFQEYQSRYVAPGSYYAKAYEKGPLIKSCILQTEKTIASFGLPSRASRLCERLRNP